MLVVRYGESAIAVERTGVRRDVCMLFGKQTASLSALQTLVHSAANGSNEPILPIAAAAENCQYGRKLDLRCSMHQGLQSGQNCLWLE